MPEFHVDNAAIPPKDVWRDMSEMERGFVEAMFFTSTGPDDEVQDANVNELSDCSLVSIRAICASFEASPAYVAYVDWRGEQDEDVKTRDTESVGNDLWYTSQGHGTGFWEGASRGYPGKHADALKVAAKSACSELYLYRGDDGLLYI